MDPSRLNASLKQAERLLNTASLHDAEAIYREILNEVPGQPKASQGLGLIALHTGNASAAVELLQTAAISLPNDPSINTQLGLAFGAAGDPKSSEFCLRRALELAPNFADGHLNLANLLLESGRITEAATSYKNAIELAPENGSIHYGIGLLEMRRGDQSAAIEAFETAVRFAPALFPARVNLANLMLYAGQHAKAVSHLEEAVAYAPNNFDAQLNLCAALQQTNRTSEAVEVARSALSLVPESPELLLNLSSAETADGHPEDAWRTLDRALGIAPDYAPAKLNRAMVRLLLNDIPGAWEDFETRPSRGAIPTPGIAAIQEWQNQSLEGKVIIVWAEQGFGDVLQFVRFLPRLKELGAKVIFAATQPLQRLLTFFDGIDAYYDLDGSEPLPFIDFHLPLLSIMHRLKISKMDVRASRNYIKTQNTKSELWQPSDSKSIGLCWQGSSTNPNDHRRSLQPDDLFKRLQKFDLELVGLQYGANDTLINNPGGLVSDFTDLALLIKQLDLVITVDTSVAHLAGAMGKPVWVMLPFAPDWRWMTIRSDSPWYPSMRLFRQARPGDWISVYNALEDAITEL